MVRANLYNYTSVGPLLGIISMLSLNGNVVTWLERRKVFASSSELFSFQVVALGICCGSGFSSLSPLMSGLKFAWL